MLKAFHQLFRRIFALLLAVLFLCVPASDVFAADRIDTGREAYLEVFFNPNGVRVEGMEFRAYRIASVNEWGEGAFIGAFAGYPVEFPKTQSGYRKLAETLKGYIASDNISPDYIGTTDANGRIEYGKVEQGMYLVLADPFVFEERTYYADPALTLVPCVGMDGKWQYDVEVCPKYRVKDKPPFEEKPETEKVTVLKVWQGVKEGEQHPEEVTVRLLCNGKPWKDDITLNKDNNWRYTWSDLPKDAEFSVIEVEVPEGYKVSVLHNANLYTITNTFVPPPEESSPPPPEESTPPPPENPPPKIPQTGQDWLMVIGLFAGGFLLMAVGYVRKRTA